MIGICESLIWSKTLRGLIFNSCCEFRSSPEGPFSQIHSPHLHGMTPGIFSDLLRSVKILKGEWGAESNWKLPHVSIPSKTAAWIPELAVEDLPLSRTATLVPEFAVKDLPLGRILMIYVNDAIIIDITWTNHQQQQYSFESKLFTLYLSPQVRRFFLRL